MILRVKDFFDPRFELTRKYPGCPFQVGDVLNAYEFETTGETYIRLGSGDGKVFPLQFPDHFKKLRWHDHRTIEQFLSIKYAKVVDGSNYYVNGDIVEVIEFVYNNHSVVVGRGSILFNLKGHFFVASQLQPATKEEYEKFKSKS